MITRPDLLTQFKQVTFVLYIIGNESICMTRLFITTKFTKIDTNNSDDIRVV